MSETPKPNPQLSADRYALAEHKQRTHFVTVEHGITRAQIMHPDFWGQIARQLRPYDEIKVTCDDGTYYAMLVVLSADRTFARVHCLIWENLTTKDMAQSQGETQSPEVDTIDPAKNYEVKNRGPHLKWCVIRNGDGAPIREKEPTKVAAELWLREYLAVVTA